MTLEELKTHDGRDGRRAYVAVNGKIYDFTGSTLWPAGDHQGVHQAGADLSQELLSAPHVRAVIERFPVVGHLEELHPSAKSGHGKTIAAALALAAILALLLYLLL